MDITRQLERLYATLPHIDCQRRCQSSCGPILMSRAESDRIAARVGRTPRTKADLQCPMLSIMGACSIYDIRPTICRIYGLTESLACQFGCVPDRWLDEDEARRFLLRIQKLGATHGPASPHFPPWTP